MKALLLANEVAKRISKGKPSKGKPAEESPMEESLETAKEETAEESGKPSNKEKLVKNLKGLKK